MFMCRLACFAFLAGAISAADATRETVKAGANERSYRLHVPDVVLKETTAGNGRMFAGKGAPSAVRIPRRPAALVIVFHGSGADGASMERASKFSDLAESEGFVVAYPDAIKHEWNDGRKARTIPSQAANVDDVAFVDAMITQISARHRIDPRRIYATGFSNGGIFAHYLGSKLAHRLAAIAPVSGGIAEPVVRDFKPVTPISVCMIHGAADKAVPFSGGNVDERNCGRIIATEETANLWTQRAGTLAAPMTRLLDDTTPSDHHRVKLTRWPAAKSGVEVVLYTIEDGGHAWPTDAEVHRVRSFWRSSRTFDATKAVWDFFKSHPKE